MTADAAPTYTEILDTLGRFAAYDGPWQALRDLQPLLRERTAELRERQSRADGLLLVALVGGSGVGKSTLLNALAGDELAAMSEFRPCTSVPTVYHPPGAELPFEGWHTRSGSALEHLVLVDTPDSDTVVREHREIVVQALAVCDLVLVCGSPEKYLDDATWSLLEPLKSERAFVLVETKADDRTEPVLPHWTRAFADRGFRAAAGFRVNALRAFERKLRGGDPGPGEHDFSGLEAFLRDELTAEQVRRIKRSNTLGLLRKTLDGLAGLADAEEESLAGLENACDQGRLDTASGAARLLEDRFFSEPHLWVHALDAEVCARARGFLGTLHRLLAFLRAAPMRLARWLPGVGGGSAGRRVAGALASDAGTEAPLGLADQAVETLYIEARGRLRLAFTQGRFGLGDDQAALGAFRASLDETVGRVLRGSGRDRIARRAAALTAWPVAILADAPFVAFLGFFGYTVVRAFFTGLLLSGSYFLHAGTVLAILAIVELGAYHIAVRMLARGARRAVVRELRATLHATLDPFPEERRALGEARALVREIRALAGKLP
jgi:GTPase SAR1 family protein